MGQVTQHPLFDWKDFTKYDVPDSEHVNLGSEEKLAANRADRYLVFDVGTVFERMIAIRGFENVMIDLAAGAPDQPWDNMAAILETFHKYGSYPTKLKWTAEACSVSGCGHSVEKGNVRQYRGQFMDSSRNERTNNV